MDHRQLDLFDERFEYDELLWGDLIYGTEAQLRALGIAGEFPGADRRSRCRKSVDPRGFPCEIKFAWHKGPDIFSVSIPFPERQRTEASWQETEWPGVCYREGFWTDDYKGKREALVTAGLVPAGCFPGDPGMRKVVVKILADGSLPTSPPTAPLPCAIGRAPGVRDVRLGNGGTFEVFVYCSPAVLAERDERRSREEAAWQAAVSAMPRPPRLDVPLRALRDQEARNRRAQLRVVWSRPVWRPGLNPTM